jgi:hypothetical protein
MKRMPGLLCSPILSIAFLLSGCMFGALPEDDGYSPNNTMAKAADITSSRSTTINDLIANDEDWYFVSIAETGKNLSFNMTIGEPYSDLDLQLLDSSGSVLVTSAQKESTETINYAVTAIGDYYLRVFFTLANYNGTKYQLLWDLL